jgi:hypothetical protein
MMVRDEMEEVNQMFPEDEKVTSRFRLRYKFQMERTLDEAYYPGLNREILKERNEDQVVRSTKGHMCCMIQTTHQS